MLYVYVLIGLDWAEPMMHFLLRVTCSCKSTSAQNPLHSGASSSTDPSPSTVRFRDDDAFKAFSKNFSKRDIHSKCQVVLSDFADTDLPSVIHSRGWESLCDVPVTCHLMLIQEFYFNMHNIDRSVPLFFTRIQGTRILITPQPVMDVLYVPRIEFPDYPSSERLRTVSKDELMSSFCERPTAWGDDDDDDDDDDDASDDDGDASSTDEMST